MFVEAKPLLHFGFSISDFGIFDFGCGISDFGMKDFGFRISRYTISDVGFRISRYRICDFGFWISDFGMHDFEMQEFPKSEIASPSLKSTQANMPKEKAKEYSTPDPPIFISDLRCRIYDFGFREAGFPKSEIRNPK